MGCVLEWGSTLVLLGLGSACSLDTERFTFDGAPGAGGGGTGGGTGLTGAVGATGGDGGAAACTTDGQCSDDVECNGVETCSNGTCAAGDPLPDATRCTPLRPDPDENYVCVAGECVQSCSMDEECDDQSACTGIETCSPVTQTCVAGEVVDCADGDACTEDICDEAEGCLNPLIDGDNDGFADEALGACGTDCNDNDNEVYPLAPELCDGKDNNCDNVTDEGTPVWYPDCDSDGFAATAAVGVPGCDVPPMAPAACPGSAPAPGWTASPPGPGTTDCWDLDNRAHPYVASQNGDAWDTSPIVGAPTTVDFDFNCDGVEEKRYTAVNGSSCHVVPPNPTCQGAGWTASTSASCGDTKSYISCSLPICSQNSGTPFSFTQQCR